MRSVPTAMPLFAVRWSILRSLQVLEQVKTGEVAILDLYPVRTLTRLTFRGPAALRLHLRAQAQMFQEFTRHQSRARHSQPDPYQEVTPIHLYAKHRLPEETI